MRAHAFVLAAIGLAGCGWFSAVESSYLIDRTRLLAVRVEVVEIGPSWPVRIGFDPDDAPITEAMPGDRVQLSGLIVGADGRARPSADFDAVWIQGNGSFVGEVPRCQDIEWTTDGTCELGRGGVLQFEVPPPGLFLALGYGEMSILGIFALEPGIDAEQCRALFHEPGPDLAKCGIVSSSVHIGPRWGLLAELAMAGVEVDFPLTEIPLPAFEQTADRLPMPGPMIWSDLDSGAAILGDPIRVHAGQNLRGEGPSWRTTDFQPYFLPKEVVEGEVYVFVGELEGRVVEWYYGPGLVIYPIDFAQIELHVDEDAQPGPVRVVMLFSNDRDGSFEPSFDFRVIEFEVVP